MHEPFSDSPRAPQLCSCGHAPLECAYATLGSARNALTADPRSSPKCCQGLARRATSNLAGARDHAVVTFTAVRETLSALRDDEVGRTTAAHWISHAVVVLDRFADMTERRTRRATTLLGRTPGGEAARIDEATLRKMVAQLRWCAAMLDPSEGGGDDE